MDLAKFKSLPLLGILRGITPDVIEPLAETVVSSGLETIEVAMNTPEAAQLIRRIKDCAGNKLVVGAGTVLTKKELHQALDAGATFIVLPVLVSQVVGECVRNKIPVFPGAFTVQEIYDAWQAKAAMVKVFPAKFLGPTYLKEIKGPLQNIELLACGGVTPDTIQQFFSCGASAVAFGASVFRKEWIAQKEFGRIEESIRALIGEFRAYRLKKAG
jgi:2-dehydro-3-deoxyphosphogluconate aldolase/(4S)-4-hydroxy-2-oxoglutarate aldolase